MSERELRDLLHRVVPEAPEPDVIGLAGAGRRSRARRRVAVAAGAVALVAAVVATVPLVLPDRAGDPPVVDFAPEPDPVYDAVPCPPTLPSTGTSNKTVPDLDRVVAVRLCGDASPLDGDLDLAAPGPSYPASPEALTETVAAFRAAVRALPTPDPDRCATVDGLSSRAALAMLLDDGSTVLVGQQFCGDNLVDGRRVDAAAVVQAFLGALDAQRDAHDYGLRVGDLTCATPQTDSPARPGREQLIDAVECPPSGADRPVEQDALEALRVAWADPRAITEQPNAVGENECTELDDRPVELLASTDRGDVVRLFVSPCGYLVYDGWQPGGSIRLPADPAVLQLG